MAVTELFPVELREDKGDDKKLSIKGNAYVFMQNDESELDELSPDEIPLPRLKLEVDSMTAIILNYLKAELFNEKTKAWVIESIEKGDYSHRGELLERASEEAFYMAGYFFDALYEKLSESEGGRELLERTDHYRAAYFRRSPIPGQEEKIYASTKQLVWAGLNTLGHQGSRAIYAIESAATLEGISAEERIALARDSRHMVVLLSKLDMTDLGRYIDALNNYEEVIHVIAKIKKINGKTIVHFNKKVLDFMRSVDEKDRSRFGHREHTGCVGSVDLDGAGSPVEQGWRWLVEVMEGAGYWDKSWVEAEREQEPSP